MSAPRPQVTISQALPPAMSVEMTNRRWLFDGAVEEVGVVLHVKGAVVELALGLSAAVLPTLCDA